LIGQTDAQKTALAEACKELDIEAPTYTVEDICNIYTWGT
jgi:hypothetical protein